MDWMDNELFNAMSIDEILLIEDLEKNIEDDVEF